MAYSLTAAWLPSHKQYFITSTVCTTAQVGEVPRQKYNFDVLHPKRIFLILNLSRCSLMARKMLGTVVNKCLPEGSERILYNIGTVVVILLMCLLWEPLPASVWDISMPWLRYSIIS